MCSFGTGSPSKWLRYFLIISWRYGNNCSSRQVPLMSKANPHLIIAFLAYVSPIYPSFVNIAHGLCSELKEKSVFQDPGAFQTADHPSILEFPKSLPFSYPIRKPTAPWSFILHMNHKVEPFRLHHIYSWLAHERGTERLKKENSSLRFSILNIYV